LLDSGDWYGVTITGGTAEREPNAAPVYERLNSLREACKRDIKTWVSCEPVINTSAIYGLIREARYIDLFRIGKLNHHKSFVQWAEFGARCVELCEKHGRACYIKDDLRAEMQRGGKA